MLRYLFPVFVELRFLNGLYFIDLALTQTSLKGMNILISFFFFVFALKVFFLIFWRLFINSDSRHRFSNLKVYFLDWNEKFESCINVVQMEIFFPWIIYSACLNVKRPFAFEIFWLRYSNVCHQHLDVFRLGDGNDVYIYMYFGRRPISFFGGYTKYFKIFWTNAKYISSSQHL